MLDESDRFLFLGMVGIFLSLMVFCVYSEWWCGYFGLYFVGLMYGLLNLDEKLGRKTMKCDLSEYV